ncbi:MAG: PqqD family peptide modification chaperone [Pseudomonadota bacterium]
MAMTLAADTILSRSGTALSTEVDGEAVLIGIETGRYYGLDSIGTAIWNRIEEPCRFDALCAGLIEDFDGDPAVIEQETRAFVDMLVERDLVRAA